MKRIIYLLFGLIALALPSHAQSSGDLFDGLTKAIPEGRVIIPYGLEVTFEKTSHIIFPAPITYVDLGSSNIIAGKASNAENVLRVKASVKDFETETTLSVICDDGSYYSFNVKYADEPNRLNYEMKDFLAVTGNQLPTNRADIYFKELGSNAPILVKLIMKTIWEQNQNQLRHIGAKQFGLNYKLKGLYTHNGLIYFHISLKNKNSMSYKTDYVSFRVVDAKNLKRTATQELVLKPLRTFNEKTIINGKEEVRTIYVLEQFTLPQDKELEITMHERNGGRTLVMTLQNSDIVRAKNINNLKLNF